MFWNWRFSIMIISSVAAILGYNFYVNLALTFASFLRGIIKFIFLILFRIRSYYLIPYSVCMLLVLFVMLLFDLDLIYFKYFLVVFSFFIISIFAIYYCYYLYNTYKFFVPFFYHLILLTI
jgi:hypothetical protein